MNTTESTLSKVNLVKQVQENTSLLSLPQILSEILDEVGKEDFSTENLAKIILKDPSLTGRILKISNSSFYHRFSEITTVHQAISVLGATTVKCMALSSSIFHPDIVARDSGVDAKEFFAILLSTAAASEKLATAVGHKAPEEAFIAGLLHELGTMYFLHHHACEYKLIVDKKIKARNLQDAELEVFGIDHAELGGIVAESLRLPEFIIDAIRCHHKPVVDGTESQLVNIVRLAVLLSNDRVVDFDMPLETRLEKISELTNALELTKPQVDEVSFSLLSNTFNVAEYLGVDIGNIEEMLISANQEIWKTYLIIENLFKERQDLSRSLLEQEHKRGAVESKNIAMATLSHYLNNATMAIYGRSQLIQMHLNKGNNEKLIELLPNYLNVLNSATRKIVAVLEEMKEISPIEQEEFYNMSQAMNIDTRLEERLTKMSEEMTWDSKIEIDEANF